MSGDKLVVDGVTIEAVRSDALDRAAQELQAAQLTFEKQVDAAVAALSGTGEFNLPSSPAGESDLPVGKA